MAEKFRVVVVDDEVDLCFLIKSILEDKQEFEVATTSKPTEAEQLIRQFKPHVILLDIVMPERRGTDIIASLKKDPELRRIPIIVVSGKGEMVFERKKKEFRWLPNNPLAVKERPNIPSARGVESFSEAYGVADYVSKPFNAEILIQVIMDVLSRFSSQEGEDKSDFSDLAE
jgi:CheY-like chemotaxis protein